jgi:hypothetical protein
VILVTVLLLLTQIPKKIASVLLLVSFLSHAILFIDRYKQFYAPTNDPSILKNELSAIDWVYQNAGGKGFYVYMYVPSVYDYTYQYLFWWYGRKKYGYVPCEYASFPGAPKLIIPGSTYYTYPTRSCQNVRYVIVEPDITDSGRQKEWLKEIRKDTKLAKESHAGKLMLEKRTF